MLLFALITAKFILGECMVCVPMEDLTILSQTCCCHGWTNIYIWPQTSAYFEMIIQIWCYFVSNITHSNHSNSQNCLMVDISPDIIVLGTSLSSFCISCVVFDFIYVSKCKHHPNFLGAFDLIIFPLKTFFSSFISLSAEFDQVYRLVCFK